MFSVNLIKYNQIVQIRKKSVDIPFKSTRAQDYYEKTYDLERAVETYGLNPTAISFPIGDRFIQDTFKRHIPDGSMVLDIGAGEGRNTIPLAKAGYKITAIEPASTGREAMQRHASHENVGNISVFNPENTEFFDITKQLHPDLSNKFNAGFMVHLTQHFTPDELDKALQNVRKSLTGSGIVIFDALVRKDGFEGMHAKDYQRNEGWAHFSRQEILDCLAKNGFNLIETSRYQKGEGNASYTHSSNWNRDFLNLEWFVIKKIEHKL